MSCVELASVTGLVPLPVPETIWKVMSAREPPLVLVIAGPLAVMSIWPGTVELGTNVVQPASDSTLPMSTLDTVNFVLS